MREQNEKHARAYGRKHVKRNIFQHTVGGGDGGGWRVEGGGRRARVKVRGEGEDVLVSCTASIFIVSASTATSKTTQNRHQGALLGLTIHGCIRVRCSFFFFSTRGDTIAKTTLVLGKVTGVNSLCSNSRIGALCLVVFCASWCHEVCVHSFLLSSPFACDPRSQLVERVFSSVLCQ